MAKSQRSSAKKAIRRQRRETLKATWQDEADARRYAALAKAQDSEAVPFHPIPVAKKDEHMAARKAHGGDAMETNDAPPPPSGPPAKRKMVRAGGKGGIKKKVKHNKKKVSALWTSQFHKSRKGKRGEMAVK